MLNVRRRAGSAHSWSVAKESLPPETHEWKRGETGENEVEPLPGRRRDIRIRIRCGNRDHPPAHATVEHGEDHRRKRRAPRFQAAATGISRKPCRVSTDTPGPAGHAPGHGIGAAPIRPPSRVLSGLPAEAIGCSARRPADCVRPHPHPGIPAILCPSRCIVHAPALGVSEDCCRAFILSDRWF